MNTFSKLFNSTYFNEKNDCKKGKLTEVVPTYTLLKKNAKSSKEYNSFKSVTKNYSNMNEIRTRKIKQDKNILPLKGSNDFLHISSKWTSTHKTAQKENLPNVSVKNNCYSKSAKNVNIHTPHSGRLLPNPYYLHNSQNFHYPYYLHNPQTLSNPDNQRNGLTSSMQEVISGNTTEREKEIIKLKQPVSNDYVSKAHKSANKQSQKEHIFYVDYGYNYEDAHGKVSNIPYGEFFQREKDNYGLKNEVGSSPLQLSVKTDHLNNTMLVQNVKIGRSLSHINHNERKKENSVTRVNVKNITYKGDSNKNIVEIANKETYYSTPDVFYSNVHDEDSYVEYGDHHKKCNITDEAKHGSNFFPSDAAHMEHLNICGSLLQKNMNNLPLNRNKNLLIRTTSYKNANNDAENLKEAKKECSSYSTFFNENIKDGKYAKRTDAERYLFKKIMQNYDIITHTDVSKWVETKSKYGVKYKSGIVSCMSNEERIRNDNKNEHTNIHGDSNLLYKGNIFVPSSENNAISTGRSKHFEKKNGQMYFTSKFNNIYVPNNLANKIGAKDEKVFCHTFKEVNKSLGDRSHETEAVKGELKFCSNNNTVRILNGDKINDKKSSSSFLHGKKKVEEEGREGGAEDEEKRTGTSSGHFGDITQRNAIKTKTDKEVCTSMLYENLKKNNSALCNPNIYYLKNGGRDIHYTLMRNIKDFRNEDIKKDNIQRSKKSHPLLTNCTLTSNYFNRMKGDYGHVESNRICELNKERCDFPSCIPVDRNKQTSVSKSESNVKNENKVNYDYRINVHSSNDMYCVKENLKRKEFGENYNTNGKIENHVPISISHYAKNKTCHHGRKGANIAANVGVTKNNNINQEKYLNFYSSAINCNGPSEKGDNKSNGLYMQSNNHFVNYYNFKMRTGVKDAKERNPAANATCTITTISTAPPRHIRGNTKSSTSRSAAINTVRSSDINGVNCCMPFIRGDEELIATGVPPKRAREKQSASVPGQMMAEMKSAHMNRTQLKGSFENCYIRNDSMAKTATRGKCLFAAGGNINDLSYLTNCNPFSKELQKGLYSYDNSEMGIVKTTRDGISYKMTERDLNMKEKTYEQAYTNCAQPKAKNVARMDKIKNEIGKNEEGNTNVKKTERGNVKMEMKKYAYLDNSLGDGRLKCMVKKCNLTRTGNESKRNSSVRAERRNENRQSMDTGERNMSMSNSRKKEEGIVQNCTYKDAHVKLKEEKEGEGDHSSSSTYIEQVNDPFCKHDEEVGDKNILKILLKKDNAEEKKEKGSTDACSTSCSLRKAKKNSTPNGCNSNHGDDFRTDEDESEKDKYVMGKKKNIDHLERIVIKKNSRETFTDSYIYHLNNMKKTAKKKNKRDKSKMGKIFVDKNEKDTLHLSDTENDGMKKMLRLTEGRTQENAKREEEKTHPNGDKNCEESNMSEGKGRDNSLVVSNRKFNYPFKNELSMYGMGTNRSEHELDSQERYISQLGEVNPQKEEWESSSREQTGNRENRSLFEGNIEINTEDRVFTPEKRDIERSNVEKCDFLAEAGTCKGEEIPSSRFLSSMSRSCGDPFEMRDRFVDSGKWVENYAVRNSRISGRMDSRNWSINGQKYWHKTKPKNRRRKGIQQKEETDVVNQRKEEEGEMEFRKVDGKSKKVVFPWNKDNIVKLNGRGKSVKMKNITINTKLARYERVLIHTCITKLNWKKCIDNINKGIFYWIGYNINDFDHYNYMKKKKIINRIPSMYMYTKKKALTFLLSHLSLIFPSLYDFYPNTFVLPENKNIIKYILNSNNKDYYIMKPDCGSMGIGVKIINKYSDININILNGYNCYIIQKYIDNPLLMYKKKFDFRIYILLLPGRNYPKIYLSKIGFARLCTEEYKKKKRYICNTYVHLTNYSINKDNEKYIRKKNIHDKNNNKQLLSDVFIYLKNNGYDIDDIWRQIKKITCLTSLAIYSYIKEKIKNNFNNNFYFYQLIGLDILLDNTGKAWLLEVNSNPSLRIDYIDPSYTNFEIQLESMFDRYVKEPVISEMFMIVYQKIYKKFFKKKSNKSIVIANTKVDKREKQNIICTDNNCKSRLQKVNILNSFSKNNLFRLRNRKVKTSLENKTRYDNNENNHLSKGKVLPFQECNSKISTTNLSMTNDDVHSIKGFPMAEQNCMKDGYTFKGHTDGYDAMDMCNPNRLENNSLSKVKKGLFLKKENMSNIDTCVDENDIGSFSLSNNVVGSERESGNLVKVPKEEVPSIGDTIHMTGTTQVRYPSQRKENLSSIPCNIITGIDERKQKIRKSPPNDDIMEESNGVMQINEGKNMRKVNISKYDEMRISFKNNEELQKCTGDDNKNICILRGGKEDSSNSDNSYENYNSRSSFTSRSSYDSNVNYMGKNYIYKFKNKQEDETDSGGRNTPLSYTNLEDKESYEEILQNRENYEHIITSQDTLIESNNLNKETYVQIDNQENIQLDKFLNNDVEMCKSIYRNISDNVYKKKIENFIMIRSNLYKYMNCLNVLGIRYINNNDIQNFDELYNKNISLDLKKTYTKIRKDILHPLKNNVLEKNIYINLKKETNKYYNEMKIYNDCYFLFDFILKKYDSNLKKKNKKIEYYIDKNTFLCMCADIKINKIIENIDIPTSTYNNLFELNKNSNENKMYEIVREILKNKKPHTCTNRKETTRHTTKGDKCHFNDPKICNTCSVSNDNSSEENVQNCKNGGGKVSVLSSLRHQKNQMKKDRKLAKNFHIMKNGKSDSMPSKSSTSRNDKSSSDVNKGSSCGGCGDCGSSCYYSSIFCPFSLAPASNNLVNFNTIGINNMKYRTKRKKKMNIYDLEYLFMRQVFFSKYINKNQGLTLIDFFLLMQQVALLIFPFINYNSAYNVTYPYNNLIFEELNNRENKISTNETNTGINTMKKYVRNVKKKGEMDQDNNHNLRRGEIDQDNNHNLKKEAKGNMVNSIKKVTKDCYEKGELYEPLNSEIKKMNYSTKAVDYTDEKKNHNYLWHKNVCSNIYNLYEYIQIRVNPAVKNVCLETFLNFVFNKYGLTHSS
ncbi:tubulin--tyrosine ligase, putative [Plasmodium ovale curtisi]|uniref:Tubulin--tyrosine ligase, putative n=1 Tax=Plasmodium ovale curtisi TaxID=864141 RepID=A0A1A8WGZ2_PLAOA|nr:tubulin--tyrosine ligase, putative [Plasmodium ovale curtisi]